MRGPCGCPDFGGNYANHTIPLFPVVCSLTGGERMQVLGTPFVQAPAYHASGMSMCSLLGVG